MLLCLCNIINFKLTSEGGFKTRERLIATNDNLNSKQTSIVSEIAHLIDENKQIKTLTKVF